MSKTEKSIHPRKIEIVQAAVTCFLERGYHQTGVRDIAKQAGVSVGNLYNHFKGKEAVLVFIAEVESEELSEFIALLSDPADPKAALETFMRRYAIYVSRPENALLGVEILTEALRNPVIADVFGKNRSQLIDALSGCLIAGAKSGSFSPQSTDRDQACMILDTIEGHGLRGLSKTSVDDAAIRNLTMFILSGVGA